MEERLLIYSPSWKENAPGDSHDSRRGQRALREAAAVIALPPPREMPEAHFVALVVERPRPGPSFHIGRMPDPGRYFTLELGTDVLSRERRTVLCGWTREAHVNYGTGPEPTVAAFVKRVIEVLDG